MVEKSEQIEKLEEEIAVDVARSKTVEKSLKVSLIFVLAIFSFSCPKEDIRLLDLVSGKASDRYYYRSGFS